MMENLQVCMNNMQKRMGAKQQQTSQQQVAGNKEKDSKQEKG